MPLNSVEDAKNLGKSIKILGRDFTIEHHFTRVCNKCNKIGHYSDRCININKSELYKNQLKEYMIEMNRHMNTQIYYSKITLFPQALIKITNESEDEVSGSFIEKGKKEESLTLSSVIWSNEYLIHKLCEERKWDCICFDIKTDGPLSRKFKSLISYNINDLIDKNPEREMKKDKKILKSDKDGIKVACVNIQNNKLGIKNCTIKEIEWSSCDLVGILESGFGELISKILIRS